MGSLGQLDSLGTSKPFSFSGSVQASKSLMNRALVVQSFYPELSLFGVSDCDDVAAMSAACAKILSGVSSTSDSPLNLGEGGTTLRFLMSRLSRIPGVHFIECHPGLLKRPHGPLFKALSQLSVSVVEQPQGFRIESKGWSVPKKVLVDGTLSSQFASSLLLSAWGLNAPLVLELGEDQASKGYLEMTLKVLKALGMEIRKDGNLFTVPPGQSLGCTEYSVEPDMSSIFSLSCFAGLLGDLEIFDFPDHSIQPDFHFLQIFKNIGIPWDLKNGVLKVSKAQAFKGGTWNLENTPDLFPVLAVLLSQATGPSTLKGLKTLAHKESHRLESIGRVLDLMGAPYKLKGDQFWIQGQNSPAPFAKGIKPLAADPAEDHRVAMAITLAEKRGYSLMLQNPQVVRKSFPNFFKIVDSSELTVRGGM